MVYIGEIAPAHSRGFFGACLSFGISVGSVIANSLVFVWATADSWRYFFGLTSVFAAVTVRV
jgi:MFS family permease